MANGGRRLETGTTLKNHCRACILYNSVDLEHGKYGDHNHPFVASSRLPIGRHGNNDCARRSDDTEADWSEVASVDPTEERGRTKKAQRPGPPRQAWIEANR